MDCKSCTENLTAYLDGELSTANSAQMRSHLAKCSSCADELRGFQEASDFVDSHKCELDLRPGSWNAVRARLPDVNSPSWIELLAPNRWRVAFAALACVAILTLGYLWYQQVQERDLNAYINRYITARESSRSYHYVIAGADDGYNSANLSVDNPFIEVKASLDVNPFRSEDR